MQVVESDIPAEFWEEIDKGAFEQVLDMDEGEDAFSRQVVTDWMQQSEENLVNIRKVLLNDRDLTQVGDLAEFMKGQSSALGVFKVRDAAEKIRSLASREEGITDENQIIRMIDEKLQDVKADYRLAKNLFEKVYNINEEEGN